MTLTATFDPVLSRVRLSGTGLNTPALSDTFTRSTSSSWGTSDSGHTYVNSGGAASDFFTQGSKGRHRHTVLNTRHYSASSASWQNVDIRCDLQCPVTATGGSIAMGLMARYVDTSNHYLAQVLFGTTGVTTLGLFKKVATVYTQLGSNFVGPAYTPSAIIKLRVSLVGSTFKAKVWTGTEPDAWSIEQTDSTYTVAGPVGVHTNLTSGVTNGLPIDLDHDNLSASVPAVTAIVARSIDQASYTNIRNGNSALIINGTLAMDDYEFVPDVVNYYRLQTLSDSGAVTSVHTASVTPTLGSVWLKSLAYPFLNTPVVVADFGEVTRTARNAVFPIAGRSYPVAVTDVRLARRYTLSLFAHTPADTERLDLVLASGQALFVHVPPDCPIPSMFAVVDSTAYERTARRSDRRRFELPLIEVADREGPIPISSTWWSVVRSYATWQDVVNANASWAVLVDRAGTPADLVVT